MALTRTQQDCIRRKRCCKPTPEHPSHCINALEALRGTCKAKDTPAVLEALGLPPKAPTAPSSGRTAEPQHSLTCEVCSQPFLAFREHAKRCPRCRVGWKKKALPKEATARQCRECKITYLGTGEGKLCPFCLHQARRGRL